MVFITTRLSYYKYRNNSFSELGYIIALILIGITLPTKWIQLNSICIIGMSVAWVAQPQLRSRLSSIIGNPIIILLTSLYVLYAISLLYTQNTIVGLSHLETKVSLLIFPLVIMSCYQIDKGKFDLVLLGFLASCIIMSLLCLLDVIQSNIIADRPFVPEYQWYYSSDNLVARYGLHTSYFSIYCSFCIFILVSFYKKGKVNVLVTLAIITYLILFILLLASRIGIIALILVSISTIGYEAYVRRKIWVGMLSALLFVSVLACLVYKFSTIREKFYAMFDYKVDQYNEPFRAQKRIIEWESSIDVLKENVLFGVGIGDAQENLQDVYLEKGFNEGYDYRYNSHNLFLDTAVTVGLLGLLFLCAMFAFSFYLAIKIRSVLYFQFLLFFVTLSLAESTFSVQKGVVFFAFFNTLFVSRIKE